MLTVQRITKQLVEQARSGERGAIGLLLHHYRPVIYGQIKLRVAEPADVDDLVQEVCIKVFRFIHLFKHNANFKTWLYRITQTTIINYYRSQTLSQSFIYEEEPESTNASPEDEIIHGELGEKIADFLVDLPSEVRQCFYLYSGLGLAYEEIAVRMHCPIGTVRSRIHRIRAKILVILR